MRNKPNPLLASLEAKLEKQYQQKLDICGEIDLIAHLISANEDFGIGSGRVEKAINGFLETKMEIVDMVYSEDDAELLHTKHQLATRLKQVFGPTLWEEYKHFFPMLKEYWEV